MFAIRGNDEGRKAMDCEEGDRLRIEHERLRREYAAAVDLLFATGYRVTDRGYAELMNYVEETRAQWEIARSRLEMHALVLQGESGACDRE